MTELIVLGKYLGFTSSVAFAEAKSYERGLVPELLWYDVVELSAQVEFSTIVVLLKGIAFLRKLSHSLEVRNIICKAR